MKRSEIERRLRYARKQLYQRTQKPARKHGSETWRAPKAQRGIIFPTWAIYLAAAAAIGVALWYAYSTIDGRGFDRGKAQTESAYKDRDNKALQAALAKVAELQAEVQAREQAHEKALDQIRNKQRKEAADAKRQHEADLAAVRAGTLRLRDPGRATSTAQCDRGPEAAAGGTAGGGDGETAGGLSRAAAEFLLQLVHDADRNTRQLTDAQQVIEEQRRACNGS